MTDVAAPVSDEDSRAAMRAFLQRSEVRLSTIHRVGQALLGGSALILLLPLFLRDALPKMATLLVAGFDSGEAALAVGGIAVASAVCILLPVGAVYWLVGDLLAFYFTSNLFGAPAGGDHEDHALVFSPRFILPGLGFNGDELSERSGPALDAARDDEWTRSLLVPHASEDHGWRDRFDTRSLRLWGTVPAAGREGDSDRMRQRYRAAGVHADRTLAADVARTEALLARHVLSIRIALLRYVKALLIVIASTIATLAAAGIVEQATGSDPSGGRFAAGLPHRYVFLVAAVYVLWAPVVARSVTAPLRIIQRNAPGVGTLDDAYRDEELTQFESATVVASLVSLVAASFATVAAGLEIGGAPGIGGAAVVVLVGAASWLLALKDDTAGARQAARAAWLTVRGRDAPEPDVGLERRRVAP